MKVKTKDFIIQTWLVCGGKLFSGECKRGSYLVLGSVWDKDTRICKEDQICITMVALPL